MQQDKTSDPSPSVPFLHLLGRSRDFGSCYFLLSNQYGRQHAHCSSIANGVLEVKLALHPHHNVVKAMTLIRSLKWKAPILGGDRFFVSLL